MPAQNTPAKPARPYLPHVALLVCYLLWALDYPFYNYIMPRHVAPLAMIAASLTVTALVSLIPLLWEKHERVARHDIPKLIGAALLVGVARKSLVMYGLSRTSPIDGSIINTVSPLLVLLLSVMLGIDRFTRGKVIGLILGMGGAIAVILTGNTSAHAHSDLAGNLMILLAALATTIYMIWFKGVIQRYRVTTVMRWIYCIAAAVMLPAGADAIVHTDFAAMTTPVILASLFILIFPTYLPNLLLNYALKSVQPTVSSIYAYLQPIVAIAVSVAMRLDRLHWDTALCAVVIFVGVALVVRSYTSSNSSPAIGNKPVER